jgi:uncharacterized protein YdeI (YjbR/CyaY-like superfamily)
VETRAGETRAGLELHAFADADALEAWLQRQADEHPGIWLKLAKKGSGVASVTQREAVDAGLCFGWIDGLINRYDDQHYLIRFTPRRRRSKWSLVNVERAQALMAAGRVRARGLREIEAAQADGRWESAYPPASRIEVPNDLRQALEATPPAAACFATLTGANLYAILYRLHDQRDPSRRKKAITRWVERLARGETAYPAAGAELQRASPVEEAKGDEQMADHKKKGDFDQWQREDKGGNKKSGEKGDSNSRTDNQNAGHGGHK